MSTRHVRCAGFGAAVDASVTDRNELWFVSMLGNQQSLRALWARLLKGEPAVISEDVFTGGHLYTLAPDARAALRFHATRLPVTWAGWLWERGLQSGEVRPLDAFGIHAWRCNPDLDALQPALGRGSVDTAYRCLWRHWRMQREQALTCGRGTTCHALNRWRLAVTSRRRPRSSRASRR